MNEGSENLYTNKFRQVWETTLHRRLTETYGMFIILKFYALFMLRFFHDENASSYFIVYGSNTVGS